MLVAHPGLVQILERVEEAGRRELGRPDGVEDGEVGRLPLGDGVGQRLVERRSRDGDDVDLHRPSAPSRIIRAQGLPRGRRRGSRADRDVGAASAG